MTGGYKKREVVGVGIGPNADKGQLASIEGLLVGIQEDVGENHSTLYELVLENGETQNVWGSTTIDQRIRGSDIGNLCTITFVGMAQGKSGRTYKDISVEFWVGEPDSRLANWPQYGLHGTPATVPDIPIGEDPGDDNFGDDATPFD